MFDDLMTEAKCDPVPKKVQSGVRSRQCIAACGLKVGRCRQLIEIMKVCEYEGQGHFFTIYFPAFVCFVLY